MTKIKIIIIITAIMCIASREYHTQMQKKISKLVFLKYSEITEEGEDNLDKKFDSIIAEYQKENEVKDTSMIELVKKLGMIEKLDHMAPSNIKKHIELNHDTIWKYNTQDGKTIGDLFRVEQENGMVYCHSHLDRSKIFRQYSVMDKDQNYTLEEFPEDRKEIFGFNCYKVVIQVHDDYNEGFPTDLGDSIYEMYVTNEIQLPLHAILNFAIKSTDFFPLEIRSWLSSIPGDQEVHLINEIIYE